MYNTDLHVFQFLYKSITFCLRSTPTSCIPYRKKTEKHEIHGKSAFPNLNKSPGLFMITFVYSSLFLPELYLLIEE